MIRLKNNAKRSQFSLCFQQKLANETPNSSWAETAGKAAGTLPVRHDATKCYTMLHKIEPTPLPPPHVAAGRIHTLKKNT
jgi:hypothetical protein